jgi:sulfur-oxidizing protein SoxY
MTSWLHRTILALLATTAAVIVSTWTVPACAADDPMKSPVWAAIAAKTFEGAPFVYDERVRVIVPGIVENQGQVPITADARALTGVTKLVIITDLNPIQHVLTLSPAKAEPYLSFRIKVEQATPVRAAALTADGIWHVGSTYLEANGGGCSAPAMARKDADWSTTVGQSQGRAWREADGMARVRMRVRHPMDTGLAKDGTPAFYIDKVEVKAAGGDGLATLELFEPVSEDPVMTLLVKLPASEPAVIVDGRDNNGGTFRATIPTPWKSSALVPTGAPSAPVLR